MCGYCHCIDYLVVKSTLYMLNTYPRVPDFGLFLSMTSRLRDKRSSKSEIHRMTPNWTSAVKYTLYTLKTYSGIPNFGPFHSTISGFRDTMSPKIGKASNDHQTQLEHLTVKGTLYTLILTPQAQILATFALRLTVTKIQSRQKLEMHRMTERWTGKLNSRKYPA